MSLPNTQPSEPPPPYTDNLNASHPITLGTSSSSNASLPSRLDVPHRTRSGIPSHDRRSMEDESRNLPPGWVRQYDSKSHHQFFVDAGASPPRSIWHHPYDDELYLSTLSPPEREQIQNLHIVPEDDLSSADEHEHKPQYRLPPREQKGEGSSGDTLGRKIKDKLTHSTHEERVAQRRKREEEEARMYRQHQHIRRQMSIAAETGVPQLLGKDKDGKDVYIEPPRGLGAHGGYGPRSYGYNPYTQGPYSSPNAMFIRPSQPYGRPYPGYGYGYGGGLGLPLLGLGGGMLLGGLLF